MHRERISAGVAVIRGHVHVVGGAELFQDISADRLLPAGNWQTLPDMNVGRLNFSTAVVADKLYVCGGSQESSVERFDLDVGVWELLEPMFRERHNAAVAVLHGQR